MMDTTTGTSGVPIGEKLPEVDPSKVRKLNDGK